MRSGRPFHWVGLLRALLLCALAVPVLAGASPEKELERRDRRFYTYYYLNHYDDMWEVFHPTLRERLGMDKKVYVDSLRDSDLELYEAKILTARVQESRGVVEVDLVFFFRDVGKPIPRRHQMFWLREDGRWLYAGSRLLEEGEPLRGELSSPQAGPVAAADGEPDMSAAATDPPEEGSEPKSAATDVPAGPASRGVQGGEPDPLPKPRDEEPAVPTDEDREGRVARRAAAEPSSLEPSGVPETLAEEGAGSRGPGPKGERLTEELVKMTPLRRQVKLDRMARRLGPEDLPALDRALDRTAYPVREWIVRQYGRLGRLHSGCREEAVALLVEILDDPADTGLRASAARALTGIATEEAREPLEDLLLEGNDSQRIAAAAALASLGDPRSAPFLYAVFLKERNREVRRAALFALGSLSSPRTTSYLIDVAGDPKAEREERLASLQGLALGASPGVEDRLLALEEGLIQDSRETAAWRGRLLLAAALVRLEDPRGRRILEDLVRESANEGPSGEGRVLGRVLARSEDLTTARWLLDSERAGFRYAGAVALAHLAGEGNPEAPVLARAYLGSEVDSLVRAMLAQAAR